MIEIISDISKPDLISVKELFLEYAAFLSVDLSYQNFNKELDELPGMYGSPEGCLLLAKCDSNAAGCVGARKLGEQFCEMKRLYVRPEYRGKGIGKELSLSVISRARDLGYIGMRLDTLPSLKEAVSLYRSLGFKEIDAYRYNPNKDAVYMELIFNRTV